MKSHSFDDPYYKDLLIKCKKKHNEVKNMLDKHLRVQEKAKKGKSNIGVKS